MGRRAKRQGIQLLRFSESFGILDLILILYHFDQVLSSIAGYRHVQRLMEPSKSVSDPTIEVHKCRAWLLGICNSLDILSCFSMDIIPISQVIILSMAEDRDVTNLQRRTVPLLGGIPKLSEKRRGEGGSNLLAFCLKQWLSHVTLECLMHTCHGANGAGRVWGLALGGLCIQCLLDQSKDVTRVNIQR